MTERRIPMVALAALTLVLIAGSVVTLVYLLDLTDQTTGGMSFEGENDPAMDEWARKIALSEALRLTVPALAIAAATSITLLTAALAWRWERWDRARQDEVSAAS